MPDERASLSRERRPVALIIGLVTALFAIVAAVLLTGDSQPTPGASPTSSVGPARCTPESALTRGKKTFDAEPCTIIDKEKVYIATFDTSMGSIRVLIEPKLAPRTVNNFVFLARQGFYDGTVFHLVRNIIRADPEEDYGIVQGGDPTGTGSGGPGYSFGDPPPPITRYLRGNLIMARRKQPNTNGSQFFFVVRDWEKLDPSYTFFGVVLDNEGLEVLDEMVTATGTPLPKDLGVTPEPPITLNRVRVAERPR